MTDETTYEDRYTAALEPDVVLPAQFFTSLRHRTRLDGERRLMIAVLEDAVNCFLKHLFATDPKARQLIVDDKEWITSDDPSWFFSFTNVCDTLDLNPAWVREGLMKWKEAQLAARDAKERTDEAGESAGGDKPAQPLKAASGA